MARTTITQFPSGSSQYRIEFDYLARPFVVVTLVNSSNLTQNKVLVVGRDYRFMSATVIEILIDQTGFDIIRIQRQTGTDLVVSFRDGSVLTANDLTNAELQAIHIAEEGREQTLITAAEFVLAAQRYSEASASSAAEAMAAKDRVEMLMSSGLYGYVLVTSFQTGATLTLPSQALKDESNGEYFRWDGSLPKAVLAGSTPSSSGGVGPGAWVSVGDASLRGNLKSEDSDKGDALYTVKQPYVGSIGLTGKANNALFINVKQFGSVGDGVYHPLSERYVTLAEAQAHYPFVTSLAESIDYAAWQAALNTGKVVYGIDNAYVITQTLLPVSGGGIIGLGVNKWVSGFTATFNPDLETGTTFLMYGSGPKNYTLDCVSNMDVSGGVVANPSASDPYTATSPIPSYDLLDFTNGDASGTTRATLKPFSVAILMPEKGCVRLENFRIVPYFNGLDGYKSLTNTGLGDNWDVGIWSRASFGNEYRNLQVVGYWRMAGLLKTNVPLSGTIAAQGEDENYYHCRFQGYKGVSIRAHDVFRITAVTATTIEIPWSASHTFNETGTLRAGGRNFVYTSLSVSGDKIIFNGVSNASMATVGSTIRRNDIDNFGMAGTQFFDCYITSLYHHTRLMSTSQYLDQPFSRPSECMEVSGEPVRGVQVHGSTIQGWDDVLLHLHDCGNMNFYSTYFESQIPYATVGGPNATFGYGARMIASRQSTSSLPYAAGNTRVLRMVGCTEGNGVDFGPSLAEYTSGRYVTGTGLFRPRDFFVDHRVLPEQADSEVRLISEKGNVRVSPYTGGFVYVGPASGDANLQSASGSLNLLSGLRVRFGTPSTYWATIDAAKFAPTTDNVLAIGQPSNRVSVVYAGTGTINTSDERLKVREEMTSGELAAALEIKNNIWKYRFTDAVQQKYDGARIHFGVGAQTVGEILRKHGLDPDCYAFWCYDEWSDSTDEGGVFTPAGSRYGIRYDELLCFLMAAI